MAAHRSDDEDWNQNASMEELIQMYFFKGFGYEEIRLFLERNHDVSVSLSTLKRRIKQLGLKRRNPEYNIGEVRAAIMRIVNGPQGTQGYRSVWHALQMDGFRVQRKIVADVLREIDPDGVNERRAHRLKRRTYQNRGPNSAWHCDGYDKLKPFGFPIHGCIDGWSRKILWLHVTRSNNQPNNIAAYYLEAVNKFQGCPIEFITDLGTENGIAAGIHSYFMDDPDKHRYVPSPRNQRIESWWSFLRRSNTSWWINFFKDLVSDGTVDLTCDAQKECLWFCFARILQENLNHVKEHWNSHYIRRSRHDTVSGRPDALFYLPEVHGGLPGLLQPVPEEELSYATDHLVDEEEPNVYQEYFEYVMRERNMSRPQNWQDALSHFKVLMAIAMNGVH